jgi:hypothetical protein
VHLMARLTVILKGSFWGHLELLIIIVIIICFILHLTLIQCVCLLCNLLIC